MHRPRFLPEVAADLVAGSRWYEEKSPGLGEDFARMFYARCEEISRSPLACAVVAGRYRRGLLRRFPYSVYYVVESEAILVVGGLSQRATTGDHRGQPGRTRRPQARAGVARLPRPASPPLGAALHPGSACRDEEGGLRLVFVRVRLLARGAAPAQRLRVATPPGRRGRLPAPRTRRPPRPCAAPARWWTSQGIPRRSSRRPWRAHPWRRT